MMLARSRHGLALVALGRVEEGAQELRRALRDRRRHHKARSLEVGEAAFSLGQALMTLGQLDEAESLFRIALDAYAKLPPQWGTEEIEAALAALDEARRQAR